MYKSCTSENVKTVLEDVPLTETVLNSACFIHVKTETMHKQTPRFITHIYSHNFILVDESVLH